MSANKHTPFSWSMPWQMKRNAETFFEVWTKYDAKPGSMNNYVVAGGIQDEREADFIVRACNSHDAMVAALRLAIGQLDGMNPHGGVHASSLAADLRICREALALAEGRAGK